MTIRVFGFPGRYVQGPDAISMLPGLVGELAADRLVLIVDPFLADSLGRRLSDLLVGAGKKVKSIAFSGECTRDEIRRIAELAGASGLDAVLVAGGGKAIDTAKGVAKASDSRLIVLPTIASNDSPTSRLIVLYDESHRIVGVERLIRNPDMVVVDTSLIAAAPVRFFRAGIGDALSKAFEVRACAEAGGRNFFDANPTNMALMLADACHDTLRSHAAAAVDAVVAGRTNDAVESVVEATVLMSGLAFESGGLSIAHALTRGFTAEPVFARALHGELVGFGTVVQLAADPGNAALANEIAEFAHGIGLPVTLGQLGGEADDAALLRIGEATCAAPYIGHFPVRLEPAGVARAIRLADRIGRSLMARDG